MNPLPQTLLFLGIIPALILMYVSLKGYDGLYKEKIVFIMFVIGIITGILSVLIESITSSIGIIIIIILFPVLEQLFKTVILNSKRLQKKEGTVIYGLSLGLGFGSVFIVSSLVSIQNFGIDETKYYIIIFISSIGLILAHGATGIYIGYGVFKQSLSKYFLISILVFIPIITLGVLSGILRNFYLQIIYVPYGFVLYWYSTMKIMPKIKEKKKKSKKQSKTK